MFSSPKATSFATRVITIWSSGSWKTEATVPASCGGPRFARVEAGDDDAAGEDAAVEVRDEPGERAQQRRLAGARRAEQRDVLAVVDLSETPSSARSAAGVREAQVLDDR